MEASNPAEPPAQPQNQRGLAGLALANAARMGSAQRGEALPYCQGKVSRKIYFVFCSFVIVLALLAASVGVLDWFSVRESATWNGSGEAIGDGGVDLTETYWYERSFSIHGSVREVLDLEYGLNLDGRYAGSFICRQSTYSNVWRGDHSGACDFEIDAALAEQEPEWNELAENWCEALCAGHQLWLATTQGTTCGDLERVASESSVTNKDAEWNEAALCSTAKGIFAGLILALVGCVAGLSLCFCCTHRISAALIPGAIALICCLVSVIVYSARVSSSYPWQAQHDFLQLADQADADTAKTEIARIQLGFGLAIGGAGVALAACFAIIASALSKPTPYLPQGQQGVAAAVPLQVPPGPIMLSQPGQITTGAESTINGMDQAGAATAPCWQQMEEEAGAAQRAGVEDVTADPKSVTVNVLPCSNAEVEREESNSSNGAASGERTIL